ncbi:MAG: two-component system response regulator [Anaerosolibacter sp.]|jgi:two-component system response regulator DctR|uniref:response regulator n=1 Tax=Anaerosolibacter sp. TaxID=1872527 RepID=UPI002620902C|nr:response regulator [Anaerosolibacter sp.]MDF2547772.1 two-component system response regulator [Anaerosolibacter sp.]
MREIHVLIVEDDPMVQEINRRFISKVKDFRVVGIANNGSEALKMVRELKPQLVLLDVFMAKMDGLTVLKEIRSIGANVDVILITADKTVDTIHDAIRYGVIDYIIKPFKFERFKEALLHYQKMRETLENKDNFQQQDLDRILHLKDDRIEELPKGLNQTTLDLVVDYLKNNKQFHTSMELSQDVGIARVTARRYLEYLTDKKVVQVELEYGSVGRPVHRYKFIESV